MTVLSPADYSRQTKAYRDCCELWKRLSAGPWTARENDVVGNPLFNEILAIVQKNAPVRNYSSAQFWVHQLIGGGFLTARRLGPTVNDLTEWSKAETLPPIDERTWVERENAAIAERVRLDEALMNRGAEAAREFARQERELNPERHRIISLLNELGVVPRTEQQERLEAATAPLHQELTAVRTELAALRESIEQTPRRIGRRGK